MKPDKELENANSYLSKLYNIEEYDNLDISSELNVEKLLKAKEYFTGKMYEYGTMLADLEREIELAHTYYKLKHAEAFDKWCNEKDENGKSYSAARAEKKSDMDRNYIAAKDRWAELKGNYTYVKSTYYNIQERIDACKQHIAILRKENDFEQFVKKTND